MKIVADVALDGVVVLDDNFEVLTATTLANFGQVLSSNSSVDTGLMPQNDTGLLSYKKHGEKTQIAYQVEAGYVTVKWGSSEGSSDQEVVSLAHPYKIWIADFDKDLLVGLRHFASPEPIFSLEDPLYHLPLPNTNCSGYSNTGVGWVCLYRTGNKPLLTLHDKIQYAFERESGLHEPYNNANMRGTDGPRFYQHRGKKFYSDPSTWIAHTEKEGGPEWVLRDGSLIPILVKHGAYTHDDKGTPYTMGMALNDKYMPYYEGRLKPDEVTFYSNGWGKASGGLSFDMKTLNKLQKVEAPDTLDVDALIDSIKPMNKKLLDFDKWNSAAKSRLSKLVLSMRTTCCFCGNYDSDLETASNEIIPFFYTGYNPIQDSASHYYQYALVEDGTHANTVFYEVDLYQTLEELVQENSEFDQYMPEALSTEKFYACGTCRESFTVTGRFGLPHDDEAELKAKRVLNPAGAQEFYPNHYLMGQYRDLYRMAWEDDVIDHHMVSFYATKMSRYPSYLGTSVRIAPEADLLDCEGCKTKYPMVHGTNGQQKLPEGFTSQFSQFWNNNNCEFGAVKVPKCLKCATKVSSLFEQTEILGASSKLQPVSDIITEQKVVDQNIDFHLCVDNCIRKVVSGPGASSVKAIGDMVMRHTFLKDYYYAMVYVNGAPSFVVDTLENFEQLKPCKCGVTVPGEKQNDDNICTSCLDKDNNYVQLVHIN